jgi:hypothetical protein
MLKKILKSLPQLFVLLVMLQTAQARQINMLFMGNSFTFRHDLPKLVKTVFEQGQPGLTVNVENVVYGGQDMFGHHDLYFSESMLRLNSITIPEIEAFITRIKSLQAMTTPPDFYGAYGQKSGLEPMAWEKIHEHLETSLKRQQFLIERIRNNRRVKWDYVVLQSWQDVVGDVDKGYAEYVQQWAAMAEKEGIKVILYITAPHAQNAAPVKAPIGLEQTRMEMETIGKLVKRIHPFAVVPVALGLEMIQENGTDLKFRYVNDGHPNQYSAFLAANMFYAACFKESPEGLNFNTVIETKLDENGKDPDGNDPKIVFDENTKNLIQKTAFDAVMAFNKNTE